MANIVHTVLIRADTSLAKSSIQDLQTQLASLQSVPITADVTGLLTARNEINQLSLSLRSAMNPTSGKLDLSVFSQLLMKSGKTLNDYKNALFSMGTLGQLAFLSLANTIASAEAPTNRLNAKILQFGKTLKNTINWQLSSTLIHGVVGQVNQAISYAEKLNTSLNNILIVTGQNNEKMAEFARLANKTAKELNSTTTEYTNAALIYYQQGLSDKEVAARNAVTLKMANVTRLSAQTVSDQLTAIWNNFDDGTASLEHYADVITALGAATASSSTEISTGLDKFASIGKTVGLSYDYATTALATIVATTRLSAESVGTGLRTIFSRLLGLSLGETLDDGVTLNKYSDALAKVGVNVLDQYNNVKDMNTILNELGSKWLTISKELQIALAQTVGGVRLYTTIMTLMNNWSAFLENLKVAQGADGTLLAQADRYATSWEAARKRVLTATEGIYDSLIDELGIIGATNTFAGFLDVINGLVEGFGGLKSIIPMVFALFAGSAAKNMPQFFADIKANFLTMTGRGIKNISDILDNLTITLREIQGKSNDVIFLAELLKVIDRNQMNLSLMNNAHRMSESDIAAYRLDILGREYLHDAYINALKALKKVEDDYLLFVSKSKLTSVKGEVSDEVSKQIQTDYFKARETANINYDKAIQGAKKESREKLLEDIKTRDDVQIALQAEDEAKKRLDKARSGIRVASKAVRDEEAAVKRMRTLSENLPKGSEEAKKWSESAAKAESGALADRKKVLEKALKEYEEASAEYTARHKDYLKVATKALGEEKKLNADEYASKMSLTKALAETQKAEALANAERARQVSEENAQRDADIAARKKQNEAYNKLYALENLPESYRKELNGAALTEENLRAVRGENAIITSADREAILQARKGYYSLLEEIGKTRGAYKETSQWFGNFANDIENMASTKNEATGKVDTKGINDRVKEFVGKYNQVIDANKLNLSHLSAEELLIPEEGDVNAAATKLAEKIKTAATDALTKVQQELSNESALGQQETKVRQTMRDANIDATTLEQIIKGGEAKGTAGVNTIINTPQDGNNKPAGPSKETKMADKVMGGAQSLFMAVSAMNSSANTLKTIMDSSASGAEKFGAILSTTASLLMSFATATNFATMAVSKETQAKFASSTFGQSGFGKTFGLSGTIGLGISVAMLFAGLIKLAIDDLQLTIIELRQSVIDSGNEAIERLSASSELNLSLSNLINAYNAAAKAVAEGTATEKELQSAKQELITSLLQQTEDGYSNSNAVAYAYSGNMAGVLSQIDQNRWLLILQESYALNSAVAASATKISDSLKYTHTDELTKFGEEYFNIIMEAAQGKVSQWNGRKSLIDIYAGVRNGEGFNPTGELNSQMVYTEDMSPEDMYATYSAAKAMRDALLENGFLYEKATDDQKSAFESLVSFIRAGSDFAQEYENFLTALQKLRIETLTLGQTLDTVSSHPLGNANTAIQDIETYNAYREKLIELMAEDLQYTEGTFEYNDMVKNIDLILGGLTSVTGNELGNLQYISTGIENVIDILKKMHAGGLTEDDESNLRESLINAYTQTGNALFSIGTMFKLPITFDVNSLNNDLQNVIDLLNLLAEENKIKLLIDLADSFNLDEKSTSEEWAKFVKDLDKDVWKDVFGEDFDLASFTALTNDEREIQMLLYLGHLKSMYYSSGGGADKKLEGLASQRVALLSQLDDLLSGEAATAKANRINEIVLLLGFEPGATISTDSIAALLEEMSKSIDKNVAKYDILSTELSNREKVASSDGTTPILFDIPSVYSDAIEKFNQAAVSGNSEEIQEAQKWLTEVGSFLKDVYKMDTSQLLASLGNLALLNDNLSGDLELLDLLYSLLDGTSAQEPIDISSLSSEEISDLIANITDEDTKKLANDLMLQIVNTEEAEASLRAELEAYLATGFRDILQKEAELYGIDYGEVLKYAEALRESESWQLSFVQGQEDIIESSEAVALAILEAEAAITSISEKYSDWNDIVSSSLTSTMKKNAVYGEMAKSLRKLLTPTGNVSKEFAQLADDMGLVYSAGLNDKLAILDLGKGLAAYALNSKNFTEDIIDSNGDTEESWNNLLSSYEEALASYYLQEEEGNRLKAVKADLTTLTEALAKAEEGEVLSTEATNAAMNLFAANMSYAMNVLQMSTGEAMQFAQQQMDAFGTTMPEFEVETVPLDSHSTQTGTGFTVEENPGDTGTWMVTGTQSVTGEGSSSGEASYLKLKNGSNAKALTPTSGGGGGGGGGGGKKKKDHKKPDIGTRYHKIKAQQSNNSQRMDETARKKERAFGAEKIKQAQDEITLQKEQIRLLREYVDEITDYLGDDRKQMEDSFKGLGISLDIDSDGVITNFRAVEEELLRQENSLIDQYNDGPLDDEAYAEALKKIDDAREYLKIYEETRDLYEEQMIAMIEQMDDLADKFLELTKTKVELKIDISDDKIELLDYMLEKIEDDAYKVAEAIALIGDKTSANLERIDIYRSGLQEILGAKGFTLEDLNNLTDEELMSANFTQAEIDLIKDWRSELYDLNKELLETRETIIDKVVDAFDELNERVQDSYDKFDDYNSILEHYKNITELMSIRLNQQNKELLDNLGRAAIANALQLASAAFNIYNEAQGRLELAKSIYNDIVDRYGPNSQEEQQYRKILEAAEEDFEEAQEEWLEAHENALKIVEEHYTATIERISKEFEQAIAGLFGTLDYLQSAFERAGTVNDEYLQDYERLYELSKLNRDILKDIDDTNNIRSKQALRNLQAEINKLQEEGIKLSLYDIDALRKKYELEQARLALEDARNTKSEVRLQRDANGNWGYVYTSAEDEVDDAEQEYENRLYEYQKLNDEYIEELLQRALEILLTYQEVLGEIFAPDSGLTEEERQARLDEINAWRDSELAYIQSQLENAMTNLNDLLDIYYQTYGKNWAEVADTWDETRLRMLSGFETLDDFLKNTIDAMNLLQKSYQEAIIQYQKDEEETLIAAGLSTEEWADLVGIAIGNIGTNSKKTKEEIGALSTELTDNFLISLLSVITWEQEYADRIDGATEANERFILSLNDMIAKLSILESSNPEVKAARAAYVAAEAAHEAFIQSHGVGANDPDWEKAKSNWNDFITKYLAKFDTGGYTGSWGTEGRLAVVHEKENIFSAADTANLLDAAQILRTIDLSARTFAAGLGSIILPDFLAKKESLQQEVHIEASFPSVQDHNEIELAFDNLINKASLYANRKNMSSMTFLDMYTSKF